MKHILIVFFLAVTIAACKSGVDNPELDKENYEITKEKLLEKEMKNPINFLKITGTHKRNILGQTVVKGAITNHAAVAMYKDVKIKLTFYSKTKTLLETDQETIYEQFFPGDTKQFKTKYFAPKGTDSVALTIITAEAQATDH